MGRLTNIANQQKTDKGTEYFERHGYTEIYDKYIPETGKFKLLEIGIWHGDSLRMWEAYNPDIEIHALDIDKDVMQYIQKPHPYHIYIGDQTDESLINYIARSAAPFDFIIDDGSHIDDHIVASFKLLWQHIRPGGCYFIEDLHAGRANRQETVERIKRWLGNVPHSMTLTANNKLLIVKKPWESPLS